MLSQAPRAILMRALRARRREADPPKRRGRKADPVKSLALVTAYDAAKAKGEWALDRLAYREGYAHRASLGSSYRRARRKQAKAAALRCDGTDTEGRT